MRRVEPDRLGIVADRLIENPQGGQRITPTGETIGVERIHRDRLGVSLDRQLVLAEPVIGLAETLVGSSVTSNDLGVSPTSAESHPVFRAVPEVRRGQKALERFFVAPEHQQGDAAVADEPAEIR